MSLLARSSSCYLQEREPANCEDQPRNCIKRIRGLQQQKLGLLFKVNLILYPNHLILLLPPPRPLGPLPYFPRLLSGRVLATLARLAPVVVRLCVCSSVDLSALATVSLRSNTEAEEEGEAEEEEGYTPPRLQLHRQDNWLDHSPAVSPRQSAKSAAALCTPPQDTHPPPPVRV